MENKFIYFIPGLTMKFNEIKTILYQELGVTTLYENPYNRIIKTILSKKMGVPIKRINKNSSFLIQVNYIN